MLSNRVLIKHIWNTAIYNDISDNIFPVDTILPALLFISTLVFINFIGRDKTSTNKFVQKCERLPELYHKLFFYTMMTYSFKKCFLPVAYMSKRFFSVVNYFAMFVRSRRDYCLISTVSRIYMHTAYYCVNCRTSWNVAHYILILKVVGPTRVRRKHSSIIIFFFVMKAVLMFRKILCIKCEPERTIGAGSKAFILAKWRGFTQILHHGMATENFSTLHPMQVGTLTPSKWELLLHASGNTYSKQMGTLTPCKWEHLLHASGNTYSMQVGTLTPSKWEHLLQASGNTYSMEVRTFTPCKWEHLLQASGNTYSMQVGTLTPSKWEHLLHGSGNTYSMQVRTLTRIPQNKLIVENSISN